jgi:uncharacterized protein
MKPFDHNYFLGYVNEVTPQFAKIHFPSSTLLEKFSHNGVFYGGGNVGNFIVIEGPEFGFLARIIEIGLPDAERKSISEKAIENDDTNFHPSGKAELLLAFSVHDPSKSYKTVSKYPSIGSKVYACSNQQIEIYVKNFGAKSGNSNSINITIGKLTSNEAVCSVSLDSLFGRHCAVVGTTGGGKSWSIAKLIHEVSTKSTNKIILIDATGEYAPLKCESLILGTNCYFPYESLSIPDLFFLLRPTGQSQRPILLEAIRSLKIKRLAPALANERGVIEKAGKAKEKFYSIYKSRIKEIEDNTCNFDMAFLIDQIKEECVWPTGGTFNLPDPSKWGNLDPKTYDYQTSLLTRIADLCNTDLFNKLLGFKKEASWTQLNAKIDAFFLQDQNQILRISFEDIPTTFSVKEIIANAIASYFLKLARKKKFKENPVILFIDEAHQFLNKNVKDEFFELHALDGFDLIAKECRKYGLFLALSTQMPRDIPIGTLSQMGAFIVHRLINEQDRKSIESASSSANRSSLAFLPILGEGEALLIGADFPMPLLIKMDEPYIKPESNTPKFNLKN